ncbi:MAG: VTT domain-containing protein [Peptoniphilus sp.]|nr:VTT domain-containing protein [Peptoniphilus sp.]MDD7362562.1 VTT domain-containing protein [Bacillota bacterium]MDY6045039.1 VTT domain-containing protein [Peptoniphilus sp.]
MKTKSSNVVKIVLAIAAAAVFIFLFKYFRDYFTEERIREMLNRAGIWAPAIYILLWSILPIFFFPVLLLVVPSGYIFGSAMGVVYTLIGSAINITVMYFLAAKFARKPIVDLVERKSDDKIKKLFFSPSGTSQGVFFIFRLIPLISYNLINYVAGILKIAFLPYFLLSMVGITPGLLAFIYLGEQIHDPSSPQFKLAVFFLVLLTVVSLVLLSVYNKRHPDD